MGIGGEGMQRGEVRGREGSTSGTGLLGHCANALCRTDVHILLPYLLSCIVIP